MTLAIMQPYFLPYIGYFQLINAVDKFVIYDNIQYTKKGWINRNRILVNGKDGYITLPLKKDSDFLNISQRRLADSFVEDKKKLLRKIYQSYQKAPFFQDIYPIIEKIFTYDSNNLFEFIYHSINIICDYLNIKTPFVVSSSIPIDHTLKAENKVLAICKSLGAIDYINPIGGVDLYDKLFFSSASVKLSFLKTDDINYLQFNQDFIPYLSIIDVLMFNDLETISKMLKFYKLI